MMEMVLQDMCKAYNIKGIALRYFNPIGADPKLRTGIHDKDPSHVLGKLVSVAVGKDEKFYITGTNWDTRDGTGIRDYIHVSDLAKAHLNAVTMIDKAFERSDSEDYLVINLGTGRGVTVKELVSAFEDVYGKEINKEDAPPRPGDVAGAYANANKAKDLLDWEAEKPIEEGIKDALRWGDKRIDVLGFK